MRFLLATLSFFTPVVLFAQNLVPNSSFETAIQCPLHVNQTKYCVAWTNPNHSGSPDYYNACDSVKRIVGVPENAFGYQQAHTGTAYLGMFTLASRYRSAREYIQIELNTPLQANTTYVVSAYVSLAESSYFFNDRLQFCFSTLSKLPSRRIKGYDVSICKNCLTIQDIESFKDSTNWRLIQGEYTANGGEKFLTIGMFLDQTRKRLYNRQVRNNVLLPQLKPDVAYYYIDDVSVDMKR